MVSEDPAARLPQRPQHSALGLCRASKQLSGSASDDLAHILALLLAETSHDFSRYKQSTIVRGIDARMLCSGTPTRHDYARYLDHHPEELPFLLRALLISVTSFFRNPEAFQALKQDALPELLRLRPRDSILRAWVPGCATGEEAYSLALLLEEAAEEAGQPCACRIFATDIDARALAIAQAGTYSAGIERDLAPTQLERFFLKDRQGYEVAPQIRAMVIFGLQNVATHAPVIKVDLISCRNVLIYLEPDLQNTLIAAFHRALRPGGVLFLSPSESIGSNLALFTPISRRWRLYRANDLCPATAPCSSALAEEPGSGS